MAENCLLRRCVESSKYLLRRCVESSKYLLHRCVESSKYLLCRCVEVPNHRNYLLRRIREGGGRISLFVIIDGWWWCGGQWLLLLLMIMMMMVVRSYSPLNGVLHGVHFLKNPQAPWKACDTGWDYFKSAGSCHCIHWPQRTTVTFVTTIVYSVSIQILVLSVARLHLQRQSSQNGIPSASAREEFSKIHAL